MTSPLSKLKFLRSVPTAAWITLSSIGLLGLVISRIYLPELWWVGLILGLVAVLGVAGLVSSHSRAFSGRTAMYSYNTLAIVLLVLGITGVLNFLVYRNTFKWDLTSSGLYTLSDQTVKVLKNLNTDVNAVFYARLSEREKYRILLENYASVSSHFKLEYIDPDKEVASARSAGINEQNVLTLALGDQTTKVKEPDEEKLTNALIKLGKGERTPFCALMGHGERPFNGDEKSREAYTIARQGLEDQSYEVREVNLMQEGKVPGDCKAVGIMGPQRAFLEPELKMLQDYLKSGGRLVMAIDLVMNGPDFSKSALEILKPWYIDVPAALVIEFNPMASAMGGPTVPMIVEFDAAHKITAEFDKPVVMPITRPVRKMAGAPATLTFTELAKTTSASWGEFNLEGLKKRERPRLDSGDIRGPVPVALAVEGKLSSEQKMDTRIVVFGTANFASNQFIQAGLNYDFFLNAASWVMNDENLISIRKKEESSGRLEISQATRDMLGLVIVLLIPFGLFVFGFATWWRRRSL